MDSESCTTRQLKTAATPAGAQRPRFRERQVLRVADLEAEQSYLVAARRRHNIGWHGWGIVQGLEIVNTPELVVQPGIAVDGYGRELIVSAPVTIPRDAFTELADEALDVWLVYGLTPVDVPQRGSYACGPGRNSRTRLQPRLRFTSAPKNERRLPIEVPRQLFEVPSEDLPFLPHRMPPDDPAREWPIYLGTIRKAYDPNSPRPFATLTGELVTAPSGRARMQVGSELKSDTRRFAVSMRDTSGEFRERLAIDRDGNTFIRNNTTITHAVDDTAANRVHLRTTTEGKKGMVDLRAPLATPAVASPWQIYRTSVKEAKRTLQQLRVEIGHPGDKGDPKQFQFAVGTRKGTVFFPCFSLSADCTLTILGDVKVKQLVEGTIEPNPSDPRFTSLLAVQWLKGTNVGVKTATTGRIQGGLRDENNAVIPNGTVKLNNLDTTFSKDLATDAAGRFDAPDIAIGRYDITASATGFQAKMISRTLAASETIDITIQLDKLPPTGTFTGTLRDALTALIPGGDVELDNLDTGFNEHVTSDAAGHFVAPNLPPGAYDITAKAAGFLPATVHHALNAGDTVDVPITLQTPPPTARIEGSVVDSSGAVVSNVQVLITNTGTNTTTTVLTDAAGQFLAPNLAPGNYSIKVNVPTSVAEQHTLVAGQTLNLQLSTSP